MRRTTSTLLWLLLVFASGTTVGIVGHRYFSPQEQAREPQRPSREQIRQEYLSKLRSRIGVSEEQVARIVTVLDGARAESDALREGFDQDMRAIQHRSREKIRSILTAEQLKKYDDWREERRRDREKRDAERKAKENAR